MEIEIEQEECDVKWNRMGFGVQNGDWGLGFGKGIGVQGSERGSGVGNMKQTNIGNMKRVGEQDQEWGYEQISKNDKAGDNGLN